MTKDEALDLALVALEEAHHKVEHKQDAAKREQAITAIKQALALDKKAENARELGLDYEPADGTQVSKVWWDGEKLMAKPIPLEDIYQPAPVQEPVAWRKFNGFRFDYIEHQPALSGMVSKEWKPLYDTTPPAAQRQWVGLMQGVRVEREYVVVSVHGANGAARKLCEALIQEMNT
jgi:hypothetical protein